MRLRVRGLVELRRQLDQLDEQALAPAEQAAAQVIATQAKAPRRTGALAGSLAAVGGAVVSPLEYAGVVHYGYPARNITAQPFVDQAFVDHVDAWAGAYLERVDDLLDPT
jgi:hypothetical protein